MFKYVALVLALLFVACTGVTPLLSGANRINVVLEEPKQCRFLGEVSGYKKNQWENLSLKQMIESAKNDLKNNAYKMGANTVLMLNQNRTNSSSGAVVYGILISDTYTKEYHIDGRAYICP